MNLTGVLGHTVLLEITNMYVLNRTIGNLKKMGSEGVPKIKKIYAIYKLFQQGIVKSFFL